MNTLIKYQSSSLLFQDGFLLGMKPLDKDTKEVNESLQYLFNKRFDEVNPGRSVNYVVDGRLMQVNDYWHPGLTQAEFNKRAASNKVMEAKMLGKTFKTNYSIKGKQTLKSKNSMKTISIKKILIPTDFSETGLLAMDHAIHMARLLKAHLYIMHVIEAFEYAYSIYEPEGNTVDTREVHDSVSRKLEQAAGEISKEYGINVSTLVGSGRPSGGIANAVKENDIDLIIMGTHGTSGFEEYFIGSNAHKVVNMSPCPVITIQQHAQKMGFTNIVMPIDDSQYSRQKVDHVVQLASLFGAKVHVLGLVGGDEEIDEKRFKVKIESVENILKNAKIPYVSKVVRGTNIAVEAMKYSDEVNADLIVIMTDHESNLTGMFLGSISKQIVNHSKIPVMSIKPQDGYYGGYYPFGAE